MITFNEMQLLKERVEGGLPLRKIGLLWHCSPERIRQKLCRIMRKIEKINRPMKVRSEDLTEYVSLRTYNALLNAGIKTVSQCRGVLSKRGEIYFLSLKNIGKTGLNEILSIARKSQ